MKIIKGAKCAGEVHQARSRHAPGMQNSSAQCGRVEQELWGDLLLLLMDVLTEDVRKDVYGSMRTSIDVTIARNLCEQLILGCDVLSNTMINLAKGIVTIEGKMWPITCKQDNHTQSGIILPATGHAMFDKLVRENNYLF